MLVQQLHTRDPSTSFSPCEAGMHHCELEAVHTLLTQSVAHVYVSQCDLLNLHVARWPCRLVIVATMKPANVQAFQIVFPPRNVFDTTRKILENAALLYAQSAIS